MRHALPYCKVSLWHVLLFSWHPMGLLVNDQGGSFQLEGSLQEQREEEVVEVSSFVHFRSLWKERNRIAFGDGSLVVQSLGKFGLRKVIEIQSSSIKWQTPT